MSELGSRLRMAREEKSLTLDELQNITRIQKRYLAAIEEGNYEILPGKFYTRAFIKQYAEAVELEPELLFEEYKNEIPLAYEDDLPDKLSRVRSRNSVSRRNSKFFLLLPKILIAIFIIAIVVIIWFLAVKFVNFGDEPPNDQQNESIDITESGDILPPVDNNDSDEAEQDGDPLPNDHEEEEEQVEEPEQQIVVEGISGSTTTYLVENPKGYEITITVSDSDSSWIEVTNNNDRVFLSGKEFKNGESETYDFTGEAEAYIRVGRTPATEIFVNDEKLEFQQDTIVQNFIIKFPQTVE